MSIRRFSISGLAVLAALSLLAGGAPAAGQKAAKAPEPKKTAVEDLSVPHQDWLKIVAYIILPVERDVFLRLANDRDRDVFIETFWKHRDPTPGTPANEYREEILKRFAYVNRVFHRTSPREGWRTDQGRIYMILGAPVSIERFNNLGIHPCEAWSYYGDPRKDLPSAFNLLFWQRGGVGEYKLYDPLSDGPARLLANQYEHPESLDYEELYDRIREIAPTLADVAFTIIPGEVNFDFSPSPRNALIMAEIFESPKKDVNPSYATHFLDYKGLVSTEYLTNYVESDSSVALVRDPATGLPFVHFTVSPRSLNVDFYEPKNEYYCHYRLDVSLRVGDTVVFQYNRDFPLNIPEDQVDRFRANGVAIEDAFPVAEGSYKLSILLQNTVGKEFTLVEQNITVPLDDLRPGLSVPFVGYRLETYPAEILLPFKEGNKKVVVDPKATFAGSDSVSVLALARNISEDLRRAGEVRLTFQGLREKNPVRKTARIRLADLPPQRTMVMTQTVPAKELEPDYYELRVELVSGDGTILDSKTANFVVSPSEALGHPIAHAKGMPLASQFKFLTMTAQQHEKSGRAEQALEFYDRAYKMNPDYGEGAAMFGAFLVQTGGFERALEVAERLLGDEKYRFDGWLIKGRSMVGLKRFVDAVSALGEANKIYNSDTRVLNALGEAYWGTGDKTRALQALDASLKLNPEQPAARKLRDEIAR